MEVSTKDYFRYLNGQRNVGCVMHVAREMSFGQFFWSGKCPLEMCFLGGMSLVVGMSVENVSGRASVRRGCV